MKILKAENVYKSYGKKQVLTGLDLELQPGKIYGLIGRNGAGKTTLLGILTAQNTMDSGSVTYGGQPVWENQPALEQICFSRELRPADVRPEQPENQALSANGGHLLPQLGYGLRPETDEGI